jgi:hypothetical protein
LLAVVSISLCLSIPKAPHRDIEEGSQRLIATLQAGLPKRSNSSCSDGDSDQAVHASLLPLAATSWSQDWDSAEEDEAWRDL